MTCQKCDLEEVPDSHYCATHFEEQHGINYAEFIQREDDMSTVTIEEINHQIRKLRWQNKQLGKQLGKTGAKVHELRCQLAELREINHKIARGELRDLERESTRNAEIIAELRDNNAKLAERYLEICEKFSAAISVDS